MKILYLILFSLFYQNSFAQNCEESQVFNILCWNVYMVPQPWTLTGQHKRSHHIIEQLKHSEYDVIVLQEVFIEKIKNRMIKKLSECFPYHVGPPGKDKGLVQDGGILIFSKHPIVNYQKIEFADGCIGSDCYSQKGAVMVEVAKNGKNIQVVGTHLQSSIDGKSQIIREKQYTAIFQKLLKPFQAKHIPQFIVGDMNTENHIPKRYKKMLKELDAVDASNSSKYLTYNYKTNDLIDKKSYAAYTLDYILLRTNMALVKIKESTLKIFKSKWNKSKYDLSDHYAVETSVVVD